MPRQPAQPPLLCEFFSWRLFRRDGVYYADGRNTHCNLGKHSLGTRDQATAVANLRQLDRRLAVERGLAMPSLATSPPSLPMDDGWDLYLAHCARGHVMGGVGPRTLKRYRAVRDKHLKFCESQGIGNWMVVNKTNTEQYGNRLVKQGYADRSVYLELTLIKSVVGWLIAGGHLPEANRIQLPLTKPQGTDTHCYTQAQVHAMVQKCNQSEALRWLAGVIVALACTGMRIGELAALRWSDIDFKSLTIVIRDERSSRRRKQLGTARTTKGRRDRSVPVHSQLLTVLRVLQQQEPKSDGRVFHGPRRGILKPDTVRTILVRAVIEPLKSQFPCQPGEIGFEHGRLHSLRHYFCSQAFLDRASEADIKDWLGHTDSRMVAHYRHLAERRAGVRLRRLISSVIAVARGDSDAKVNRRELLATDNGQGLKHVHDL